MEEEASYVLRCHLGDKQKLARPVTTTTIGFKVGPLCFNELTKIDNLLVTLMNAHDEGEVVEERLVREDHEVDEEEWMSRNVKHFGSPKEMLFYIIDTTAARIGESGDEKLNYNQMRRLLQELGCDEHLTPVVSIIPRGYVSVY